MEESHRKEFEVFGDGIGKGSSVVKIIYIMGFLEDVMQMVEGRCDQKEILSHISDSREMLGILAKEIAKRENIPIY